MGKVTPGPGSAQLLSASIQGAETHIVDSEMSDLRTELKTDIADLRAEMHAEIGALRTSMANWMLTLLVAVVGALASIAFIS